MVLLKGWNKVEGGKVLGKSIKMSQGKATPDGKPQWVRAQALESADLGPNLSIAAY